MQFTLNEDILSLKDEGNKFFGNGRFVEAEKCYSKALQQVDHADINLYAILLTNRSNSRLHLRRFSEALQDAEEAVKVNPMYAKAKYRLAEALAGCNHFDGSMQVFRELVDEGVREATSHMGLVWRARQEHMGEFDMASLYSLTPGQHEMFSDFASPALSLLRCELTGYIRGMAVNKRIKSNDILIAEQACVLECGRRGAVLGLLETSLAVRCAESPLLTGKLRLLAHHCHCAYEESDESKTSPAVHDAGGGVALVTVDVLRSRDESLADSLASPGDQDSHPSSRISTSSVVRKVVACCGFVSDEEEEGEVVCGLWLLSSFIRRHTHSDHPHPLPHQVEVIVHGKLLIVRAAREISPGTELIFPRSAAESESEAAGSESEEEGGDGKVLAARFAKYLNHGESSGGGEGGVT
jgi:hypothetical protein